MSGGIVHVPPSAESATALVRGEPGGLFGCVAHTAWRSLLIAGGIYLINGGPRPHLMRDAIGGALALELVMLTYARHREKAG